MPEEPVEQVKVSGLEDVLLGKVGRTLLYHGGITGSYTPYTSSG